MPKPTYIQLNSITLSATATSVNFSNIPQNYRDLVLVGDYTGSSAVAFLNLRLNDDTGNYSGVVMYGSSGGSGSITRSFIPFNAIYGSLRSFAIANIMDYSATDKHKTLIQRTANVGNSEVGADASRWASTAAVNKISLIAADGALSIGSTFSLYGIEA